MISAEDYIARFVDGGEKPACEFVDGLLIPKAMGTRKHSQVQANITTLIRNRYDETLNPLPELTARLREGQFYIPDISVEQMSKPIAAPYPGPRESVLLCVEIVSPPDRVGKLFGKCEEYHSWGVPYCWVIDPENKKAWESSGGSDSIVSRRFSQVREFLTAGSNHPEALTYEFEPDRSAL